MMMNQHRSKSAQNLRSAMKPHSAASTGMNSQSEHLTSSSSPSYKLKRRSVNFDQLEIYEFAQTLGDNPSCSDGVPLTIEWVPKDVISVGVDYYELTRDPRRTRKELAIPGGERQVYLLSIGYKMQDLFAAAEKVQKIKKERAASFRTQQRWGKFYKVVQSATNAMKSVVTKPAKHESFVDSPVTKRTSDDIGPEDVDDILSGGQSRPTQKISMVTSAA